MSTTEKPVEHSAVEAVAKALFHNTFGRRKKWEEARRDLTQIYLQNAKAAIRALRKFEAAA